MREHNEHMRLLKVAEFVENNLLAKLHWNPEYNTGLKETIYSKTTIIKDISNTKALHKIKNILKSTGIFKVTVDYKYNSYNTHVTYDIIIKLRSPINYKQLETYELLYM